MSVLSHSNVQILWEVLNGLISDNKLKISNMDNFRGYFDNKCKEYHVRRFDYNGLSDINKHIVSECFEYLRNVSRDSKLVMFREYEEYGNKNIIKNMQVGKRYEEHQNNFKSMINAKTPNEIEFGENIDEPIGDMDNVMSKRMEERDADINNITGKYNQGHDSIKWLNNSGDIPPKLTIHNESNNFSKSTEIDNKGILKREQNNTMNNTIKEKNEKTKKVKFQSDFLSDMNNLNQSKINNEELREEINDEDIKKKASIFQNMTEKLNSKTEENSRIYLEKREIINIIDDKDKIKEVEDNTDIMDVFSKMKKKTDNSDIKGAQRVDIIDINKKMDKIENYLVDVLKNQIDLMKQQKEILSQFKYNSMMENDKINPSFSAI